jgi:hypothetical protein
MSFEEKLTWVNAVVSVAVPVVYFTIVLGQLGETAAADIAYQRPLLIAIGASIVLTIIGAIGAAIGTAITAEITGVGSVDDIDRKDERDVDINRRGELVGYYVSSAGMLGVLALTMLEYDFFWIASALYASFALGSVVSAIVKLVAYRRGF